jgi:hypothetical protein
MVVYGGVWWCMVVYGGVWWCMVVYGMVVYGMVVYGGVWWCMVVYGGVWWCMVVYGGVFVRCITLHPCTIFCTALQILLNILGRWTLSSGFEKGRVVQFLHHKFLTFKAELSMVSIFALSEPRYSSCTQLFRVLLLPVTRREAIKCSTNRSKETVAVGSYRLEL